jgi:O-acetyl-ADP-ribose deacetylase (regulator of RNase III)
MIHYLRGDLFLLPGCTSFMHGCNAVGSMGKGIAIEFKTRWPAMYSAYKKACLEKRISCGELFIWQDQNSFIFNAITQPRLGACAKYDFVENCCKLAKEQCEVRGVSKLGLPRIGAGIGGLDWDQVKKIFNETFTDSNVQFLVIEDYIPNQIPRLDH